MIQKKICLAGALAVGKTSIVSRFVRSMFPERHLSTVGVKIDRKFIRVGDDDVGLIIWDLAGEDPFDHVRAQYVRGSAGFVFVADGTRPHTMETAIRLQQRTELEFGPVPFVLAANKCDLRDEWTLDMSALTELTRRGWSGIACSALDGTGVDQVFRTLTERMLAR